MQYCMHGWLALIVIHMDAIVPPYDCSKILTHEQPQSIYTSCIGCCLLRFLPSLQHTAAVLLARWHDVCKLPSSLVMPPSCSRQMAALLLARRHNVYVRPFSADDAAAQSSAYIPARQGILAGASCSVAAAVYLPLHQL